MLLGLALRLWFIAVNDIDPRFSAADDGDYYQRALRLAATGQYLDNSWLIRPPGHVFLFAGLLKLAMWLGDPAIGIGLIRGVHVALSLLLIPIGYDMARRLFGRPAGLIFAAVLAVWFPLVELPALILSEPLFLFTLSIHCWLLVRWRDARRESWGRGGGKRRPWLWLAAAGLVLGYCALTRSPALYGSVFSLAFIAAELRPTVLSMRRAALAPWLRRFAAWALIFLLPFAAVIAPWTARNYLTYGQVILIDTLGPVNLWMAMSDAVNDGRGENEAKAILAGIPQEERQDFVSADLGRIIREEPLRLTRNFWPHFLHIWKAQFVEDFFVKVSFFTRPLREIAPLGALGDLLWLVFSAASLFTLAGRPREGGFRLVALGWIAYSCLTVMLIHVEPRYLLPVWLFMALYGAAALGALASWLAGLRHDRDQALDEASAYLRSPWGIAGAALCAAFLVLVFTYRDYPGIISRGMQREGYRNAGASAYAKGDAQAAIAAYEQMLAVAPDFIDGRTELARIYLDLGQLDKGWEALSERQTHRGDVVRGALARAGGDLERAAFYFEDAEVRAGEDVQKLTLEWLHPAPVTALTLGDGLDFGYVQGFSFGEELPAAAGEAPRSYRWLRERGRIVLPLPATLRPGMVVRLRVAGGVPGETPLTITLGGVATVLPARGGEWRVYQIAVPASLAGQSRLELGLRAPTFIPVQQNPASGDARLLSVMVSDVVVE
ncbi:MAG: tetratricopeptide repeat protein [Chloroflexales bacterium]|nr:tetratricopeptide repeat protein [Chloroflexales bacterium]